MISVIIPAHNERENLDRLVPYLQDIGKGQPFEIIVSLSANSSDYDRGIFSAKVTRVRAAAKGRAVQMNYGARFAKGGILAFLHADVLPPRTFFIDIESTIRQGFKAGFFSYRFDKVNLLLRINASFTARDGLFTGGGDQCLYIDAGTFREMQGFDESQVLMEDFEFFGRMKKKGIPYKIVKNDLIVSARKYNYNSYLRINLSNLLLLLLFKFGYPAKKLKTLHNRLVRMPD
jgi:glycosyltransferase involved in cell wall biosynthesis